MTTTRKIVLWIVIPFMVMSICTFTLYGAAYLIYRAAGLKAEECRDFGAFKHGGIKYPCEPISRRKTSA